MKKLLKHSILAIAVAAYATVASAIPLTDLLNGAVIQQGDKIFGDFGWTGPTGPAGFDITGIGSGAANDLFGIRIQGPLFQIGVGASDWGLTYSVTVAPGDAYRISDIHQYVNVSGTPGTYANVSEDVRNGPAGAVVAHSAVGFVFTAPDSVDDPTQPSTWEFGDIMFLNVPLSKVWINKDILFTSPGQLGVVSGTIIEQRFSQVPVPDGGATVLMLGAALGGLAWVSSRRKK